MTSASDGRPQTWRSLEELESSPDFDAFLQAEFPEAWEAQGLDKHGRRAFLKLMGASLGLAGVGACVKQPEEKIVPYVRAPEESVPGRPKRYATAVSRSGYGQGVLVETHMGRPTKVEGNPEHPASLGATDPIAQAEVLSLYDPDRSQTIRLRGAYSTWNRFVGELSVELERLKTHRGRGLRILTGRITSPTLHRQLVDLRSRYPEALWHQYESVSRDNVREGTIRAFGEALEVHIHLENASTVFALQADVFGTMPGAVRNANKFMGRRARGLERGKATNRLYVAESTPTVTGASADHRFRVKAGEMPELLVHLAFALGVPGFVGGPRPSGAPPWLEGLARDLAGSRGEGLLVVGDCLPPEAHHVAHAINVHLGHVGHSVSYTTSVEAEPVHHGQSVAALAEAMKAGLVESLFVLGANPVFDAPADVEFGAAMSRVNLRVHLGAYDDETARLCHWHVPLSHAFESWSDVRAPDGTASIVQPLIAPMYESRTAHELLALMNGQIGKTSYELVKETWQRQYHGPDFDWFWKKSLHDGVVRGTRFSEKRPTLTGDKPRSKVTTSQSGLELTFHPDPCIYDGRYANNGWLQELPKPISRLTWDNAALVSPATGKQLGLENEDLVALSLGDRSIAAPVWIVPGQADDSVAISLGYGQSALGRVAEGRGVSAERIRTKAARWCAPHLEVSKKNRKYPLASTQSHHSMEGRALVRSAAMDTYLKNPAFAQQGHGPKEALSLFPPHPNQSEDYAWAMSIDLNKCTGCQSCVLACQSENNVSVVGKEEVARGREMHWIRVDRYFEGTPEDPEILHQPVTCMHCENAPCEVVCPVNATVHGPEGLNQMVYNRCVGTRYCSNNCPYKVRRFNFRLYADWTTPSLRAMRNPDVTVRSRGVMEKCTYCVQRIQEARLTAKKEDRKIRDGEVTTACQGACPTQAITFGNKLDQKSRLHQTLKSPRNYTILKELNTKARTSYMARVKNPNEAVKKV